MLEVQKNICKCSLVHVLFCSLYQILEDCIHTQIYLTKALSVKDLNSQWLSNPDQRLAMKPLGLCPPLPSHTWKSCRGGRRAQNSAKPCTCKASPRTVPRATARAATARTVGCGRAQGTPRIRAAGHLSRIKDITEAATAARGGKGSTPPELPGSLQPKRRTPRCSPSADVH